MAKRDAVVDMAQKGTLDVNAVHRPGQSVDSQKEYIVEVRPCNYERIYSRGAYKRCFNRDPITDDKLEMKRHTRNNGDHFDGFAVWFGEDDILERRVIEVARRPPSSGEGP